jgi:hypothetical protein
VAHPQQLPARRLAGFAVHRAGSQSLPKLAQAAQHRGFGKLPAQRFPRFGDGQSAFLIQSLPQLEHQGRHLVARGLLWRMLPVGVRAQAENIGKSLGGGHKIRLLAPSAKQVQRDHLAGFNQTGKQHLGLGDCLRRGRRLRSP